MTPPEEEESDGSVAEVANYEGSFEDAVNDTIVPVPGLMSFNDWISWRAKDGMRPTKKHGSARASTSIEESGLWRRAMVHFHGEDWREQYDLQSIAEVGESSSSCSTSNIRARGTFGVAS